MPYHISPDDGGDSPENTKWMENCVSKVEGRKGKDGKPLDKSSAIAICKTTLHKAKGNKKNASFILSQILQG